MTIKEAIEQLQKMEKTLPKETNINLVIDCYKCGNAQILKTFEIVVIGR